MDIAVIIPAYGPKEEWANIDRAIESVLKQDYPYGKVTICVGPGYNLPEAKNRLISSTNAQLILPLDADDALSGQYFLQYMYEELILYNAGIVYPIIQYRGESGETGEAFNPPIWSLERIKRDNFVANSSLYRRDVWYDYRYNEEFALGYEDYDFYLGAAENGYKFAKSHAVLDVYPGRRNESAQLLKEELFAKIRKLHPNV